MKIKIIKPEDLTLERSEIESWPIWTCDVSEFDWEYSEKESCLILEGEVEVVTKDETVRIVAGDFVIFPRGLTCRWKVMKPVRKHYSFG